MRDAQVVIASEFTGARKLCQRHRVTEYRHNHNMNETLGSRARKRRKELGKTLAEIAKAAGISTGFLSDLEQDRSRGTTKLHKLADALGLPIDYLASGSVVRAIKAPVSVYHGYELSQEACEFAREWDKLEEPLRSQIVTMVESLVAADIRRKRRSDKPKLIKDSRRSAN